MVSRLTFVVLNVAVPLAAARLNRGRRHRFGLTYSTPSPLGRGALCIVTCMGQGQSLVRYIKSYSTQILRYLIEELLNLLDVKFI